MRSLKKAAENSHMSLCPANSRHLCFGCYVRVSNNSAVLLTFN
jgi:hypothetical protein